METASLSCDLRERSQLRLAFFVVSLRLLPMQAHLQTPMGVSIHERR
jgi:hypothetical protein